MQAPIVSFGTSDEFLRWLEDNHAVSAGIWLHLAKKGTAGLTYPEALEAALCFGWIDGQKKGHDDKTWLQHFCPRKSGSIWSQVNRDKAVKLIEAGTMRPAGLAAVERAKASGEWERAYQPGRSREIPPELEAALAGRPKAREFFDTLDSQNRFAFVFRTATAKKPETRLKRAAQFVEMMENHQVFYPKPKKNGENKDE